MEQLDWTLLVTGGAGFIGSNFVRRLLAERRSALVINLDALTYAGSRATLEELRAHPNHIVAEGRIGDRNLIGALLHKYEPAAIVNFAAETHVDRSILAPASFVQTNVVETCALLDVALEYWQSLDPQCQQAFRFLHISTDEVYGSLESDGFFTEQAVYAPNSPYAASKAAADHLARAYHKTYGLPVIRVHPSNNYGPYQHPEKLVPLMILRALEGLPLPVYGDGQNVRDWLHVEDCCDAILTVLENGQPGGVYNVGARNEKSNIEIVRMVCRALDEMMPPAANPRLEARRLGTYEELIVFVKDRPGHDRRYGIDPTAIETQLGWRAKEPLEAGIRKTVQWYLSNGQWCEQAQGEEYREWVRENYGERMGDGT